MNKEIKEFKKYFLNYVENCEKVLAKEKEDMFRFDKDRPIVNFKFANEDVFIIKLAKKYRVGYLGKINDREDFETLNQCFVWLRKHLDTESKYDYCKKITKPLYDRLVKQADDITAYQVAIRKEIEKTKIEKVIHNKATTVVWFADNEKVIVKKAKDEKDSVYSAVAYAIAKRVYESNSHFQSVVDKVIEK